jgi:phytoene dehydrogenase-like protein
VPSNSYDLVVLGDDLAALVCATLCVRRGLRTLVLGDDRPARYTLGPHKLPIDPVMWPSTTGSAADRVLKELHAELALRRKLREPKIAAQIVTPDLRIDLGADRLVGELEREVGKDAAAAWIARWDRGSELARSLDPMLGSEHAFPGVGFFERRELVKLAERATADATTWWTETQAAGATTAAIWRHLAAIALRHPSAPALAVARAVDAWRTGPSSLRGDGDGIRELLVEKLTTAGGEVRAGKVAEIDVSWGKISKLTLANGDELGAGQVVASRPPAELAELLGKKAPKRLAELASGMTVVGYRYTLNIVIDEAGLPEHMAPTVAVIAAPDKDPSGDSAFSIHLGETDDTGRVIATIAAVLPSDGPVDAERLVSKCMALRTGLWKRLGDVMPFFERHLVLAHSPFEATPPQVPGGRGSYDVPRNLPLAMTPVWAATAPGNAVDQATGSTLTYMTGLKNLTLTGEQVLPSLGLEGALASGWSAAKVACAVAGKKKDYLRDEVVGAAS